mmetsp:Transcript_93356/g.171112  ORF Transcript_93356/g.171112 Transcript_93356/m.171112 type:complete len:650 (-) Transcript_93356:59-2008(-)
MQPTTPSSPAVLTWSPPAVSSPWGGENIRGSVHPPTTPKHQAMRCRAVTSPKVENKEAGDISKVVQVLSDNLMERMELLLHRQEQVIARLLEERSNGVSPAHWTAFSPRETAPVCASAVIHESKQCLEGSDMKPPSEMGKSGGSVSSKSSKLELSVDLNEVPGPQVTFKSDVSRTGMTSSSYGDDSKPPDFPQFKTYAVTNASFFRKQKKTNVKNQPGSVMDLYRVAANAQAESEQSVFQRANSKGVRALCKQILNSRVYDVAMTLTIIFNTILIIGEADANADCDGGSSGCAPAWMGYMNIILLIIYTIESFAIVDVYRERTLCSARRAVDLFVVVVGYVEVLVVHVVGSSSQIPSMQALKLIRLARLIRGVRLLRIFPELQFIIVGFAGAMRTMMWGLIILMTLLLTISIVAVELIQPVNKRVQHDTQYCSEAFESVWNACILFFQTIPAGDSWGRCTIPIILEEPWVYFYFVVTLVAVQVGFLNLIMSVILDRAAEARSVNTEMKMLAREKEISASRRKWFDLFEKLDEDGSGELSLSELLRGFDELPDFNTDLQLLGIEKADIPTLLNLLDTDDNKRLSVDELVSMFETLSHFDMQMGQVTMGMQIRVIGQRFEGMLRRLERELKASFVQLVSVQNNCNDVDADL